MGLARSWTAGAASHGWPPAPLRGRDPASSALLTPDCRTSEQMRLGQSPSAASSSCRGPRGPSSRAIVWSRSAGRRRSWTSASPAREANDAGRGRAPKRSPKHFAARLRRACRFCPPTVRFPPLIRLSSRQGLQVQRWEAGSWAVGRRRRPAAEAVRWRRRCRPRRPRHRAAAGLRTRLNATAARRNHRRAGRSRHVRTSSRRIPVDGEVLRRLIGAAGGGVRVRDLSGRTGTATAMRGGLAVVTYPDGVERLDPAWLAWAGKPMGSTSREESSSSATSTSRAAPGGRRDRGVAADG